MNCLCFYSCFWGYLVCGMPPWLLVFLRWDWYQADFNTDYYASTKDKDYLCDWTCIVVGWDAGWENGRGVYNDILLNGYWHLENVNRSFIGCRDECGKVKFFSWRPWLAHEESNKFEKSNGNSTKMSLCCVVGYQRTGNPEWLFERTSTGTVEGVQLLVGVETDWIGHFVAHWDCCFLLA